jgi:hypothetical protein
MAWKPFVVLLVLINYSFEQAAASQAARYLAPLGQAVNSRWASQEPASRLQTAATAAAAAHLRGSETITTARNSVSVVGTPSLRVSSGERSPGTPHPPVTPSARSTRFTVAMLAAGDAAWYRRLSVRNKVAYAIQHSYVTAIVTSALPHSDAPQRSYAWQKVGGQI